MKLQRPTLEEHVEFGNAIKDAHNANRELLKFCKFLYAKEQDAIFRTFDSKLGMIQNRMEEVMYQDFPWLTNDANSVYYHMDERVTADKLKLKAIEAGMVDRNHFGGLPNPNGKAYDINEVFK